jgi:hypothetical protein
MGEKSLLNALQHHVTSPDAHGWQNPAYRPAHRQYSRLQGTLGAYGLPCPREVRGRLKLRRSGPGSCWRRSLTIRTARSFSSGGYRFDVAFFSMTPSSLPRYGASKNPRPVQYRRPKNVPSIVELRAYLRALLQDRGPMSGGAHADQQRHCPLCSCGSGRRSSRSIDV